MLTTFFLFSLARASVTYWYTPSDRLEGESGRQFGEIGEDDHSLTHPWHAMKGKVILCPGEREDDILSYSLGAP